jgi:uncharacterized membrane protein YphA (DoxX/SURF4 family)
MRYDENPEFSHYPAFHRDHPNSLVTPISSAYETASVAGPGQHPGGSLAVHGGARLLLPLGLCLAIFAVSAFAAYEHNAWVFSWDSAAYIEAANSAVAGHGFLQRTISGLDLANWTPMRNWPLGYPSLIAALQSIGVSSTVAAFGIAVVSSGVFVALLFGICQRFFSWPLAVATTLTVISMPAFLDASTSALSDSLYLACATASLYCLMRWSASPERRGAWVAGAGALVGAAWSIRNAGLAVLAASAAFLACHVLWLQARPLAKQMTLWCAAAVAAAAPMAIRNWRTFGTFSPFVEAPSHIGLWGIIRVNLLRLAEDLATSSEVADLIVRKEVLLAIVLVATGMIFVRLRSSSVRSAFEGVRHHRFALLLGIYVVAQLGLLIAARWKLAITDPPGQLPSRHFVQIHWCIWILVAWVAQQAIGSRRASPPWLLRSAPTAFLLLIAGLQMRSEWRHVSAMPHRVSLQEMVGVELADSLRLGMRKDQIVLATRADLLRIYPDVNARKIAPASECWRRPCHSRADLQLSGRRGQLWGVVLQDTAGVRKGTYGTFLRDLLEREGDFPEFRRIISTPTAVAFRYVGGD